MVLPGNTAHRPPHPTRFPTVSPHSRRLHRRPGLAQLGGSGSSVVEKYDHENLALRATLKMLLRAISSRGFGSTGSEHPWGGRKLWLISYTQPLPNVPSDELLRRYR